VCVATWPSHDIVMTNIIWCIAYPREVERGVVYCPIVVQYYCTRGGQCAMQLGGGNDRMVDPCTAASK